MIILIYLISFLLALLLAAASIFFVIVIVNILSLLVTRVPPIATAKKYFARIFQQVKIGPETVIYDLGCGTGEFLLAASAFHPQSCIGYELSPIPYALAVIKAFISGRSSIRIYFKNFFQADISDADIVYIYLVPPLLGRVALKLKSELKPGAVALVKGTPLPDLPYGTKIILDDQRGYPLYVYKF